jgi:hypothetical protein
LGLCQVPLICNICRLYRSWPSYCHIVLVSDIHISLFYLWVWDN